MSTAAAIQDAVGSNRLCPLELEFRSDTIVRSVLLHPELMEALNQMEVPRMGLLRADLESFVRGQEVSLCFTPYKHKEAMMGLLDPTAEGTWDYRSRKNSPGIRVFGRFAAQNVFVALEWRPRSRVVEGFDKVPLGDPKTSREWQFAMIETKQRWEIALPKLKPVIGGSLSDCLSNKCSAVGP